MTIILLPAKGHPLYLTAMSVLWEVSYFVEEEE